MATQVMERTNNNTSAPQALQVFRDRLISRRGEIEHALAGSGISPDRFIRTAITAAQTTPELISDCSFQSLWVALLKACRDRLLPDGRQGAIVPYKRVATWLPMYRGLLDRFEQSGHYKWIGADFHREDDASFDQWVDEHGQHFLHRPGPRMGRIIETYAAATTKEGGFFLTVITEPDMQKIRAVSRSTREDSPWKQWPEQMMLKSALRRLAKTLPMPQPLEDMLGFEDEDEPPSAQAPARSLARPRGVAQALEQFAGEQERQAEPPQQSEPPHDEDGVIENEPAEGDDQAAQVAPVLIETAHERGREARRTGSKRTAIPPEYREADRGQEAVAWRKGWDGEPLGTGALHDGQS